MNTTTTAITTVPIILNDFIYSNAEKGILPLAGLVITPLMSAGIYFWSRRRVYGENKQEQRAYIFYRALSGTLLGLFLCHIFFKSTTYSTLGPQVMALFVVIGVCLVDMYDNWTRVCNDNKHFVTTNMSLVDSEITLDRKAMEEQDYVKLDGEEMTNETLGRIMFDGAEEWKDNRKRWHVFCMLIICMIFVVILQGMFLVYNERSNKTMLIVAYFVTQMLQNVVIFGGMVHAKIHVIRGKRRQYWWWSLTAIWSIVVTCAVIPVLIDMNYDQVAYGVTNYWLCMFYSLFAGLLLGISFHFRSMKLKTTNKKNTLISIVVYIVFAVTSWATGMFI